MVLVGVGGYVLEALARCGIGKFVLVDSDKIDETNINRQILATNDSIGKEKVLVAKERVLSINKEAKVEIRNEFVSSETEDFFDTSMNYIIDAIDSMSSKIEIIKRANNKNIPVISCMGTGNKMNPLDLEVSDIYKTSMCPVAKIMRKELKKIGIDKLKVVYSKEQPKVEEKVINEENNKQIIGSVAFVPSVAGLIIASEVVKDIIKGEK